jgi:hypothetical protein
MRSIIKRPLSQPRPSLPRSHQLPRKFNQIGRQMLHRLNSRVGHGIIGKKPTLVGTLPVRCVIAASISRPFIMPIGMSWLWTRMHTHLRPEVAPRSRNRQRLLPSRLRPSPGRAFNRLPAHFLLSSLNLNRLNRNLRRLILPSRRRDMSRLLPRTLWLRLPHPRCDRPRLKPSQHRLRSSLCIPCRFRRGSGSTHHSACLSGQQFAIARRFGISRSNPCRSLCSASAGCARTFLRTRINPVLGTATPVAMRRQALIHLLLPRRGSSIMR